MNRRNQHKYFVSSFWNNYIEWLAIWIWCIPEGWQPYFSINVMALPSIRIVVMFCEAGVGGNRFKQTSESEVLFTSAHHTSGLVRLSPVSCETSFCRAYMKYVKWAVEEHGDGVNASSRENQSRLPSAGSIIRQRDKVVVRSSFVAKVETTGWLYSA